MFTILPLIGTKKEGKLSIKYNGKDEQRFLKLGALVGKFIDEVDDNDFEIEEVQLVIVVGEKKHV